MQCRKISLIKPKHLSGIIGNCQEVREMKDAGEAFTGLEAEVVFVAFVIVAAVFMYIVLGSGFFTTQKVMKSCTRVSVRVHRTSL